MELPLKFYLPFPAMADRIYFLAAKNGFAADFMPAHNNNITIIVVMIEGPAAESTRSENSNPKTQPTSPNTHPNTTRLIVPSVLIIAVTAGIINKEKMRSTPATLTEEVTTTPNVA